MHNSVPPPDYAVSFPHKNLHGAALSPHGYAQPLHDAAPLPHGAALLPYETMLPSYGAATTLPDAVPLPYEAVPTLHNA